MMRTLLLALTTCLLVLPAQAKYSGGSGTAQDPYQIATAADLFTLGETPADYDKHFILTADIDLDPNLPGRKVFDKAVISPDTGTVEWAFKGTPFAGVLAGGGHTISHLTITGNEFLGLFGQLGSAGQVKNLGMVEVNITSSGNCVGGLVGSSGGAVTQCYSTGAVSGKEEVGGLVGCNGYSGNVTRCYSTAVVSGYGYIGGLAGYNGWGSIIQSYGAAVVSGGGKVGGLVGEDCGGTVIQCYSTGAVSGETLVGGLVGSIEPADDGYVTQCYSIGAVSGADRVGGLVGYGSGNVSDCFWDTQTSGRTKSAAGTGKATTQMQGMQTYLEAGWDFVGETENGVSEIWQMSPKGGYPLLAVFSGYTAPRLQGAGTAENPYLIHDALELGAVVHYSLYAHYRLAASIDLSRLRWSTAVIPWFGGTFEGNSHTISGFTISGANHLGIFGQLVFGGEVKDLGVVDVNIIGSGGYVGALVGDNGGALSRCYSAGAVSRRGSISDGGVGGLVGANAGILTRCYSTASVWATDSSWSSMGGGLTGWNGGSIVQSYSAGPVTGGSFLGGLVGYNDFGGTVSQCYSKGAVKGINRVGGLVGHNGRGDVTQCYSTGPVSGDDDVGGLVGCSGEYASVTECYSTGAVRGTGPEVGGLVGFYDLIGRGVSWARCGFWDIQTSGQAISDGGTGKTTAEMQTAKMFLGAGWDFVGETANGTEDIWWIDEGKDYPHLWWEAQN